MENDQNTSKMRAYSKWVIAILIMSFNSLNAKNLNAGFQYFTYQNEKGISYVETYLTFLSTEINYKKVSEASFQGSILINMTIKKGEDIYHVDKYLFQTPLLSDTLDSQIFIDKQIIALNNGNYVLDLELKDNNANAQNIKASTTLSVNFPENKRCFSDIMLLDNYRISTDKGPLNKSGYDLIPMHSQGDYFLDEHISNLNFYAEWYKTELDTITSLGYLFNYCIENYQTHIPISGFNAVKRKTSEHQAAHIGGFDISLLPSGNYDLVLRLLDRKGKGLIEKRLFFQRRNTKTILKPQDYASLNSEGSFVDEFTIIEELAENISSLFPIATPREWSYASNQLSTWDLEQMKKFFYGFWVNRNPLEPEAEWGKYYEGVKKANELFSANKIKGFATDRGRVFLKHGTADYIENSVHENHTLPYQIWTYNKLGDETNRLFIFAESAVGTNDYELIHSTARGELYNENWKNIVYRTKH